jgi:DNA ligase (NAD+)
MTEQINALRLTIIEADLAYYNGDDPIMEDATYDAHRDELKTLSPNDPILSKVGAETENSLEEITHTIPMGSLEKITEKDKFFKWISDQCKKITDNSTIMAKIICLALSYKLDGSSISVEYHLGKMIQTLTRGKGDKGSDITENARKFQGLPQLAKNSKGELFTGFVRCEAVLAVKIWEMLDKLAVKKTNPRNTANGICLRKSGFQAEYIQAIAFRAYNDDQSEISGSEESMLEMLTDFGFDVSPSFIGTPTKVWEKFEEIGKLRPSIPYWIDGCVIKINAIDAQTGLGESNNRPRGQIALKYEPETAVTKVKHIRNTVGHIGAITPTVMFDPTEIAGTIVQKATLSNWTIAKTWAMRIGDTIKIHKAGEIIPEVLEVVERNPNGELISEPTECPICQGEIGYKELTSGKTGARLFCLNPECSAKQTKRLHNFLRKTDIKGVGDVTAESLVSEGVVKTFADFYTLHQRKEQLYSLHIGSGRLLGEKRSETLLANIAKKKELSLDLFLGSLGINELGRTMVSKIIEKMPDEFSNLEDWKGDKLLIHAKALGIPNQSRTYYNSLQKTWPAIEKLIEVGVTITKKEIKEVSANAKSFCITGALSQPKKIFHKMIEDAGHIVKTTVNKELDYLIMADKDAPSKKTEKAQKMNVTCIDEADLLELIKQTTNTSESSDKTEQVETPVITPEPESKPTPETSSEEQGMLF